MLQAPKPGAATPLYRSPLPVHLAAIYALFPRDSAPLEAQGLGENAWGRPPGARAGSRLCRGRWRGAAARSSPADALPSRAPAGSFSSPINRHHLQPFQPLLLCKGERKKKKKNPPPAISFFACEALPEPSCVREPAAKPSPAPPAGGHHPPTRKKPASPPLSTQSLLLNTFLFGFYLTRSPPGAETEMKWGAGGAGPAGGGAGRRPPAPGRPAGPRPAEGQAQPP